MVFLKNGYKNLEWADVKKIKLDCNCGYLNLA